MKVKPKDLLIIGGLGIGVIGALVFLVWSLISGGTSPDDDPTPPVAEQELAPLAQETRAPASAPAVTETADTEEVTGPTSDMYDGWTGGSGPGVDTEDEDVMAAVEVAKEFVPIYRNEMGFQYDDSHGYMKDLLDRGLITQSLYDQRTTTVAQPSRTKDRKIEVMVSKQDCPTVSQSGPMKFDDSGQLACYHEMEYASEGNRVERAIIDELALLPIEPGQAYTLRLGFVKENGTWKVNSVQ